MKNRLMLLLLGLLPFQSSASENFSDHEVYCAQQKQLSCLDYISLQLKNSEHHSDRWYEIKSYQFDYYYDQMDFLTLKEHTEPFIQLTELPQVFQVQVYFYYAKSMHYLGEHDVAQKYATKAFEKLQAIFDSFGNPMRMVELANLQHVFGNKETALQILDKAERRFGKSKDPIFHFELSSNKAHVFHSLGDLESALISREAAVDWILKTSHARKITLALGNLARTHQLLEHYSKAAHYYQQALEHMSESTDQLILAIYKLRLAELNWQAGNHEQAVKWFKQVHKDDIRQTHTALYTQLKSAL
ncbi:tetratricopeptide repeat protein [Pseudoalteromonas sp. N1230-9]|uniref:tetratricopeptide repeat protein n=1 Tax=Pseudoalteromonas sp. N1230-9 TaxID=2907156 RepID=UPI002B2A4F2D|nr:tetratricopeptide repeat protein [Pseudoalteromonas sp. N1230-9]